MRVYIVDDDHAVHAMIGPILASRAIEFQSFFSGEEFLKVAEELDVGCALLDVHMPGMDGYAVQARINERGLLHPIVFVTGDVRLPDVVEAMRNGAIDFLQKPFRPVALLLGIDRAFAQAERRVAEVDRLQVLDLLTKREREVLNGLARGQQSKMIAYELGISIRTVEMHRANIMVKLGVKSMAPILLMAQNAGLLQAA